MVGKWGCEPKGKIATAILADSLGNEGCQWLLYPKVQLIFSVSLACWKIIPYLNLNPTPILGLNMKSWVPSDFDSPFAIVKPRKSYAISAPTVK